MFQMVVELKRSAVFCGNGLVLTAPNSAAFNKNNTIETKLRRRKILIVPILLIPPILSLVVHGGGLLVQCKELRLLEQECATLQQMRLERLDVMFQHLQRILFIAAVHPGSQDDIF